MKKPINKTAKGNRNELRFIKMMESLGWECDKKPRTRWHSPDIFGVWDVICRYKKTILFAQIKSNRSDWSSGKKKCEAWLGGYKKIDFAINGVKRDIPPNMLGILYAVAYWDTKQQKFITQFYI